VNDMHNPGLEDATAMRDDSGLFAFATVLALHRIAVDPQQLRHGLGHDRAVEADDLKRLAKRQEEVAPSRYEAATTSCGKPRFLRWPTVRWAGS